MLNKLYAIYNTYYALYIYTCILIRDCKDVLPNSSTLKTFSYFRIKFTPHFDVIFTSIRTIQITKVPHNPISSFKYLRRLIKMSYRCFIPSSLLNPLIILIFRQRSEFKSYFSNTSVVKNVYIQ